MNSVSAYLAVAKDKPLELGTINRRDVGSKDIKINIEYAGICHSDIHVARNEWHNTTYPVVPGHEIAGVVAEVGSEVTKYKVGDRVGVGVLVESCGTCSTCTNNDEPYCTDRAVETYNSVTAAGERTHGGYSKEIVVTEHFVFKIPDSIPLDKAAPLLCAGITTYSPLKHWGAGPGKKVAIVGMGGLGHLAVKFAHALGAEVTVLSQSLQKAADGKSMGADYYYATSDPETFTKLAGNFDLILNTVSAELNINNFINLLKADGTLVELGIPEQPFTLQSLPLITKRRSLSGSFIGGVKETQEMLDFCAEKNITPEIEIISADKINTAYEEVIKSKVRYRYVIDVSTLN